MAATSAIGDASESIDGVAGRSRNLDGRGKPTAEADRGRHPGYPNFTVLAAGPGSIAERSTSNTKGKHSGHQWVSVMPLRHTVYCKRSVAAVTPENLLKHLEILDFLTLGEDYDISVDAVRAARPLRIKDIRPGQFRLYHLSYGEPDRRPIEIDRWESEDQRRGAIDETIDNLTIEDRARVKKISDFLRESVDRVSVSFGIDPPAAMFAWEVVRYFASKFDGIIKADDGEWLKIGVDYQPMPV
jgi:hypothetical protein